MTVRTALLVSTMALSVSLTPSPAHAQAQIAIWEAALQRFLSGLKIAGRQDSLSSESTSTSDTQTRKAATSAITAQDTAQRTARAKQDYSPETGTGYSACQVSLGLLDERAAAKSGEKVREALRTADANWIAGGGDGAAQQAASLDQRRTFYCSQAEQDRTGWCKSANGGLGAGDSDASPFLLNRNYAGEEVATAADFLDVIAPLPTIKPNAATADEDIALITNRRRAAIYTAARSAYGQILIGGMGGD